MSEPDDSSNADLPHYIEPERRADATVGTLPPEAEEAVEQPEAAVVGTGERRRRRKRSARRNAIEWGIVLVGAVLVAIVIKTFLIQAFYIPTSSMEPTLDVGDRVLVNKLSYDLHDVNRGDLVVFKRPGPVEVKVEACNGREITIPPQIVGANEVQDLIKRVIALPGETVEQRDGRIYINGKLLDEPYLAPTPPYNPPGDWAIGAQCIKVPADRVWVMGDNRGNSSASNAFGPIEESSIIGRAFIRVWPLGEFGGV